MIRKFFINLQRQIIKTGGNRIKTAKGTMTKFQVSIFNLATKQKQVRFICNDSNVVTRQQQVEDEVKYRALCIVLTEIIK